jgi:hypothetical protein
MYKDENDKDKNDKDEKYKEMIAMEEIVRSESYSTLMKTLIDHYGFTFTSAEELLDNPHLSEILRYMRIAYDRGVADGKPHYGFSGGF